MRRLSLTLIMAGLFAVPALAACPPGKISCAAWCKKYRLDPVSYGVCMHTHPTGSCDVLGPNYCAYDRFHF